jgi:RNA polymerase sigma factor for flagellar operon FliA
LITEHLGMARRIALRVSRRLPEWLSQEDVIAAAMVGLTEAADRYNDSRGEPFVAFAEKRIRGAVLDQLRRGDILPRRVRVMARRVGSTLRALEQQLGRPPEDDEVAAALSVPVEEYRERLERLTHVAVLPLPPRFEEHPNLSDSEESAISRAEQSILLGKMKIALTKLPQRDAQILSLYYVEDLSYAEIGQVLGVSESRVCQLHARALARLRAEIAPEEE